MGHDTGSGHSFGSELPARVSQPRTPALPPAASRIWITIIFFGAGLFLLGMFLDFFLVNQKGLRPITAAAILNAFFGLVAAFLVYRLLAYERDKCNRMLERLEVVDEMNHHIRNALQVISFSAHGASSESELLEIQNAVTRIQWAVREILPRVEPEFAAFDGSARTKEANTHPDEK